MKKVPRTGTSREIHIFWIGEDAPIWVSQNLKEWGGKYSKNLIFWSNRSILNEGWQGQVSQSWPKAMQVDLMRVLAVSKFGGWYVDADTAPLSKLLPEVDKLLLIREDGKRFCNGVFYAPKNHPFMTFWLNEIIASIEEQWPHNRNVAQISGPHALSRALYIYASVVGVERCREEIEIAPWRLVSFRNQSRHLSLIQNCLRKRYAIEHNAKETWVEKQDVNKSFLGDTMYLLRQSPFSSILDFIRQILKNPRKFPRNMTEYKILRNLDNGILDLKEPWEVHKRMILGDYQLVSAMRNLKIGVVSVTDPLLSEKLLFAGWEEIKDGEWIRPRVTDLLN